MRGVLTVLVLATVALTPALAAAGGAGSACSIGGHKATIAKQEIKAREDVQTAQRDAKPEPAARAKKTQVVVTKQTK